MKRLAERLLLLFAAFVCLAAAAPLLHADSNVRIVRLSYVDGTVEIDQRDGQGFETAFMNMPVTPGTRIQTRSDSRAEIELEDGSTLRLAPNTLVEFTAMSLRSDGSRDTMVELEGGTAYLDLRHQRDDDFRLNVAHNTMTLRHTVRFRVSLDDRNVTIVPIKGDLEVLTENGKTVDVRKGETLSLDLTDPDHFYRAHESAPGDLDAWDQEREDYRDNFANNTQVANNGYDYSPGYSYGASDMNYYGAYSYLSGYGWVWQPTYMPLGWNPYMDGAWVFYPGYGWQWVSAYPWGWVPYHYGNWFYVSGRGWCWRAHHRHRNDHDADDWHPAPVIVNPPPHFQPPTPPPVIAPPPGTKPGPRPGPIPPVLKKNPRVVIVGRGGGTIYPPGEASRIRGRLIDQNDERETVVTPPAISAPPTTSGTPAVTPGVVVKTPPPVSGTIPVTRIDNDESVRARPVPPVTPPPTTTVAPPSTTVAPPPSRGRYLGPPQTNENPPSTTVAPPPRGRYLGPPVTNGDTPSPPAPRYVPPTPAPTVTPPSPPAPRYVPPTPAPRYNPPPSPPPRPVTPPSSVSTTVSRPSPPSPPPSHNTGSGSSSAHHDHPR